MQETQVQSLVWEDPLENEMATHSSILAWEIPWMEEPGGLQFMGLQKSWTQLGDYTATTHDTWETVCGCVCVCARAHAGASNSFIPGGKLSGLIICILMKQECTYNCDKH